MKAFHLIPVLLTLTLPVLGIGQEPLNSPIHADGSCEIEGVVFRGMITREMRINPPSIPAASLMEEGRHALTLECRTNQLELHLIFGDGSGERSRQIVEVWFTGDFDGFHGTLFSENGLVSRMYGASDEIFQFDVHDLARGGTHKFVDLNWLSMNYREFAIASISPAYQRLFSNGK